MSSSPTDPTSTTASSSSSASDVGDRVALVACGAIAQNAGSIAQRNGWLVDVHPLPPLLHNQPHQIAGEVRRVAEALLLTYEQVAVGYADCGTYGALDAALERAGVRSIEISQGQPFDAASMRGVGSAPAPDPSWVGRVASTERCGFRDGARVVRPPDVIVYTTSA